jgi:hypothetical protein
MRKKNKPYVIIKRKVNKLDLLTVKKLIAIMSFWGRCVPMMESAGLSLKSRMALNLNHIDTQKNQF